eukprot:Nk52_evm12s96 gene=Nk52_evmTU12s96
MRKLSKTSPILASKLCHNTVLCTEAQALAVREFDSKDYGSENADILNDLDHFDALSDAWNRAKESGRVWGGASFGGRGILRLNGCSKDVCVQNCTLAFAGKELLKPCTLKLRHGARYGLIGNNGVGKSTLLKQIARGGLPGFPRHLRVHYIQQESVADDCTVLESVLQSSTEKKALDKELEVIENELEEEMDDELVARMGDIYERLEAFENGEVMSEVEEVLKGLQFTEKHFHMKISDLSGGWRMRLAIAHGLFSRPDILLLDEPSNHLDLIGVLWLESFLNSREDMTCLIVSHDQAFLSSVTTDIIIMQNQTLTYHNCSYGQYLKKEEDLAKRNEQRMSAQAKKEEQAKAFIEKQRAISGSKNADPNKQRQAKERANKMDRLAMYRGDRRYKTHSMAKWMVFALPDYVQAVKSDPTLRFALPVASEINVAKELSVIKFDKVSFAYPKTPEKMILEDVSFQLDRKSRVAIVGKNGAGKTTLLNLINQNTVASKGEIWHAKGVKIGFVGQNHLDKFLPHLNTTVLEYFQSIMDRKMTETELRSHLGSFGVAGNLPLQKIGSLSGGQKARLSIAAITRNNPNVLIFDEPTNHLDMMSISAVSHAIKNFNGPVIIVSHNRTFMEETCNELWLVKNRGVKALCTRETSFQEAFSLYLETIEQKFARQLERQ